MNKTELIDAIASDAGISKAAAKLALNSVTDNVTAALKEGKKVSLVGWGTWSTSVRSAREGRNPQNRDQVIQIPEKTVVKFKAGATLAKAVN